MHWGVRAAVAFLLAIVWYVFLWATVVVTALILDPLDCLLLCPPEETTHSDYATLILVPSATSVLVGVWVGRLGGWSWWLSAVAPFAAALTSIIIGLVVGNSWLGLAMGFTWAGLAAMLVAAGK